VSIMRNPNGFGTVYRMSGNRRKPWRATVNKITIGYFDTKAAGMRALGQYDESANKPKSKLTLKNVYEELQGITTFTDSQVKAYSGAWKHLAPLHDNLIVDIRASTMQELVDKVYQTKSQATVKVMFAVLKRIFSYAAEQDVIGKDYTMFLKLPKSDAKPRTAFTKEQIELIKKSNNEWSGSVLVLIYMGWRISEFFDLLIEDVDLEKWTIKGGGKTEAGRNRIVPIHEEIRPIITKWVSENKKYLIEHNGKKLGVYNYRENYFKPFLLELGIEGVSPHTCRHTTATILSKAGASTKSIQLIMGHAEYSTTAQTYTHLDIDDLQKAMKKIM